jgi:hypothetical protein
MKIIKPAIATAVTEGIILAALWKLGTFPVFYLAITAFVYGWIAVGVAFLIFTWAVCFLWIGFFNRSKRPQLRN